MLKQVCLRYRCVLAFDNQGVRRMPEEENLNIPSHFTNWSLQSSCFVDCLFMFGCYCLYISWCLQAIQNFARLLFDCQIGQQFQLNKGSTQLDHIVLQLEQLNISYLVFLGFSNEAQLIVFTRGEDLLFRSRFGGLWGRKPRMDKSVRFIFSSVLPLFFVFNTFWKTYGSTPSCKICQIFTHFGKFPWNSTDIWYGVGNWHLCIFQW